jgi:5-methylcytosine-specific restriction endonuclease McrA
LRLHTGFDGIVNGDFSLDPIDGVTVSEALRRIERDLYRQDQRHGIVRSPAQRMAAALVEMAVRSHTVPADGRRPEPLLCILAGEATVERLCELATGIVIAPGQIVPHLDRSQVQTFIFDGADQVIAASPQRSFRGMLRRAIQVRDRHCQHPSGCDAPITRCDVDHRIAHRHGGVTAQANAQLECEPHNRKSDLHGRQPADAITAARDRRALQHHARRRLDALIADQANRPPPHAP